jgi:hypothetical protein
MTLPKFIVRGANTQTEQKKASAKMVPQGVKHTDLLKNRFLEIEKAPAVTNPQSRRPIADGSEVHEDEEVGED